MLESLTPMATPALNRSNLHRPRILCLHGGGTNARIFHSQCRVLRARLSAYFRLVFVDAPFYTAPGPDVVSVYAKWGPFRGWFPPGCVTESSGEIAAPISESWATSEMVIGRIEKSIQDAMKADDHAGATGQWVAVLGFSQGAKMAASLLYRQQTHSKDRFWLGQQVDYRFAVLLAGRAPMVSLSVDGLDESGDLLHLPTIHVHGLKDPGLALHRELYSSCQEESTRLIEWDGGHRVPIRTEDVMAVVDAILAVAGKTGCFQ
ncbi:serine hydrolase FSH [Aspergillus unguis]